jgi:long-chain acyl-CoA synthetase
MIQGDGPFNSVYEALAASAHCHGAKAAILYGEGAISYADLLARTDLAAANLRAQGIGPGVTLAAYCQNCPELILAYYAAAKLGAVFVPLNPNLTPAEVAYAFRHSGAQILLHDEAVAAVARSAAPTEALLPISVLAAPAQGGAAPNLPARRRDDDFLIIYTSGSTGTPKAVVLDHAAQVDVTPALARMWGIDEADVTVVALPLGYLYGLSTAAGVGLQCGGTVVILRRFHPQDVLQALVAHKATVYHGVPTMFSMMLEFCEQRGLTFDLSSVRALICAGAPLSEEMRKRFAARFGKELQNYYAMTESTPVFGKYASDPEPMPKDAAGKAAPGLVVRIERPDGTECGVGEEGEILVRAVATLKCYLADPKLTEASTRDGLFCSGDLGRRDAQGYFYITGRIKDVIIRGGANISPLEVERVLNAHPGVREAAVIGVPDRIFGEVPVAFIARRHGDSVTEAELVRHAEAVLSDFKVPRHYVFEVELPQGKTGKVDKAALKERYEALLADEHSAGDGPGRPRRGPERA